MKKGLRPIELALFRRSRSLETSPDEEGIKTPARPLLPVPRIPWRQALMKKGLRRAVGAPTEKLDTLGDKP